MSETNLVEKFSEVFTNAIKNANIFEKFLEIKRMSSCLIIFTSISGVTLLFYAGYNSAAIENIDIRNRSIENRLHLLDKKIDKLIEINKIFSQILIKNNNLLNKSIENQLLYICKENNSEVENFKNNGTNEGNVNNIEDDIKNIIEDTTNYDEVINECYDNIPCNNSKKITGLNRILNWN